MAGDLATAFCVGCVLTGLWGRNVPRMCPAPVPAPCVFGETGAIGEFAGLWRAELVARGVQSVFRTGDAMPSRSRVPLPSRR